MKDLDRSLVFPGRQHSLLLWLYTHSRNLCAGWLGTAREMGVTGLERGKELERS